MATLGNVLRELAEASRSDVCMLCTQPVPFDEIVVPEALDYMMFFCGLACYDQWRQTAISELRRLGD